ncbi:helix-turn-helix domain-containing protein [Paraburkholderia phenoliruptrix]|uniref:helix-turn-helix domain-containing protein n=1 Tax=Paraburkholderia phenoliruptrix TaxID=252970 RepID=UPI001C4F1EB8|nr:helix-turn-helix domain-containing protein [Paraburkholderia phenoliruptrix]MBW0449244.1 helix-turn-helix domain-containing protein [Paraburkholderia phenoliruptrix]MBW9097524.1 helix-turn-helix domain-containing protein [Paraburkholderia phenoliruptrix]
MTPATLDISGAADMMKMHPNSVLKLIQGGVLPAARIGRAYVLMTKDVMDFVEQQIISQTAERMQIPGRRVRHTKASPARKR